MEDAGRHPVTGVLLQVLAQVQLAEAAGESLLTLALVALTLAPPTAILLAAPSHPAPVRVGGT